MVANALARYIKIFVGSDSQEWTLSAGAFEPQYDLLSDSGIIATTASLELLYNDTNPESLDPLTNPTRWRMGQSIVIQVADQDGDFQAWNTLYIVESPAYDSITGRLTLQLGCWLEWGNTQEPDDDQSGVETGTGQNSAAVATTLLEAAGIPSANISLSGWEYTLDWPLVKDDPSSFVSQAGKLAWANDCRFLYQNSSGVVVSGQWDGTTGTPVATITLGSNDLSYTPQPDPIPPVEKVQVDGVGYLVSTLPDEYSEVESTTEPASNIKENAAGDVSFTTTITTRRNQNDDPWTLTIETRVTQPSALAWIGSDSLDATTITYYDITGYDATTERMQGHQSYAIADVRVLVGPEVSASGQVILYRDITEFVYNDDEVLIEQSTVSTEPRMLIDPSVTTNIFSQAITEEVKTTWTEEQPDLWSQHTTRKLVVARSSRRTGAEVDLFARTAEPAEIIQDSTPPATQYWPPADSQEEVHYEGVCDWVHPGGATGRTRTRIYTVDPGFSNEQCFNIATRIAALLEGRSYAHVIQSPVLDALLWCPPLSAVAVVNGGSTYNYRADGLAWEFGTESARVGMLGVLTGMASGIVPGQTPDPEPTPLPLPTNSAPVLRGGYRLGYRS